MNAEATHFKAQFTHATTKIISTVGLKLKDFIDQTTMILRSINESLDYCMSSAEKCFSFYYHRNYFKKRKAIRFFLLYRIVPLPIIKYVLRNNTNLTV